MRPSPRLAAAAHDRRATCALLVAAALASAAAVATPAAAQTDRHRLDGSAVAIYNIAGRITVEPGSGADVVVEVTRRGPDADRLRIATGDIGDRNTLRVLYPDDDIVYSDGSSRGSRSEFDVNADGTWGGSRWSGRRRVRVSSRGSGTEAWADIRILVPSGRRIDVYLGVGALEASRVNADLTLDAASASILAVGSRGRLDIDAGSGQVEVRDADTESLDVDTGSGGIRLTDVRATACNIDAGSGTVTGQAVSCDAVEIDVGSGNVRLADLRADDASVDAGSGNIQLDLRRSPRRLNVESGSGGVTVGLPDDVGADVEISTGSGGIQTDFPLQTNRYERNHLRGRIGNGSARINIETGSGSVRLRRLA